MEFLDFLVKSCIFFMYFAFIILENGMCIVKIKLY